MWLKKETGGTTIEHEAVHYHFPADDPLCEVPARLGTILLAIRGGGYAEVPAPPKPAPAPKPDAAPKVTPAAAAAAAKA